jgi:protein-S-isoprenylcysteine O-methyltransferase Ste14
VFMALFIGCSEAIGWLKKGDPELLAARMKSPISADQKFSDRAVMGAILVVFIGWFVFMAVDARRYGWSHTPLWAQALGAALIVGPFYGWVGVLRANSFAAVTVRLQEERGQTVISTGPYAVVRHPMYAYAVLLMIGAPLLLGSLWGLLGVVLLLPRWRLARLARRSCSWTGCPVIANTPQKCASAYCPVYGDEQRLRRCRAERRTEAIRTPVPLICKIR